VAPETQQSAAGHSLTIHTPLRIKQYDERHTSVYGTPTDSVLVGIQKIMTGVQPDLVLSGINHGQNTADDVTYSGTVAAAIEATLMGIPAIALSQDYDENGGRPDWAIARKMLPTILQKFQGFEWEDNVMMNINFPMPRVGVKPEVFVRSQGHFDLKNESLISCLDPRGRPYYWVGPPPKRDEQDLTMDMGALKSGHVTVTPLSLNLTHHATMKKLEEVFS
jgi:5'-nucleotidase